MNQSQNIKTSQKSKTRANLKKDIKIKMIHKSIYPLCLYLVSFAALAEDNVGMATPKFNTQWSLYASLNKPSAKFYYSDNYRNKVGEIIEIEVLKNYDKQQYVGNGYGKDFTYKSVIEVQHIDCNTGKYQSKLVKAFKQLDAKEPAYYSEQTAGEWRSSEGNGGQKYLHQIVCQNSKAYLSINKKYQT
jgi:hypothetical protein